MIAAIALALALSPPPVTARPDPALTPGVTRPLTLAVICTTRWGRDHRAVTGAMKAEAFRRYGFTGNHDPRCTPDAHGRTCEIDHLVSRELGGADDVDNLWPQPYGGPWNARDKDRLENRLHVLVCGGSLTLDQAQTAIRSDWIAAFKTYVAPNPEGTIP